MTERSYGQIWPIGEDGKPLSNDEMRARLDDEVRTVDGRIYSAVVQGFSNEPEDNWHAESDKLAFWLIMSIPIGFIVAAVLVLGVSAVDAL